MQADGGGRSQPPAPPRTEYHINLQAMADARIEQLTQMLDHARDQLEAAHRQSASLAQQVCHHSLLPLIPHLLTCFLFYSPVCALLVASIFFASSLLLHLQHHLCRHLGSFFVILFSSSLAICRFGDSVRIETP